MRSKLHLLLIFLVTVSLFSCKKGGEDATESEMRVLNAWIQVNNITVSPTASGMYFIPVEEGSGANPLADDYFFYNYSVENLNGDVYSTNDAVVAETWGYDKDVNGRTLHFAPVIKRNAFGLNTGLMSGMYEALLMMKKGGKARLILPSSLASNILGQNVSVIVNLELVDFKSDISAYEKAVVVDYKTINNLTDTIGGKDGIYYKTLIETSEKQLNDSAKSVKVWYVGRYLDGYIFDTNIDTVAANAGFTASSTTQLVVEFGKGGSIPAFEAVLKKMWTNEKTKFVTTSEFAYGSIQDETIPPFTPLVFEIIMDTTYVKK